MPHVHESQFSEWAEPFPGANYLRQTLAVAEADLRKLIHDPVELLTRMVQPVLWLLIFGQVFNRTRAIPTGGISYLDFMSPGILAQSVLFGAIFYGISLIWERDLGIVQKFLVSPAPRSTLVLGRAISSTARSLCQMLFVYVIAFLLHVQLRFGVFALAGVVLAVMLGSAVFSTFSLIVACLVKSRERFDAFLASRSRQGKSADVSSGCPAHPHGGWWRKCFWIGCGLPDANCGVRDRGGSGDEALSEHSHVSSRLHARIAAFPLILA
jgi:hypothetical protein